MSKTNLLSVLFFCCAFTTKAQTDTVRGQEDPVVVTANKYEQKQSTTGKVITVISKDQLTKSNGKTLSQVLNEQAGLVINGALNNYGSVQTVYMRGAASGRTLILLDGIPVNDPSMINNEFDLNLFSIDNVDRIEICKGAQSTLYGSDAIAGVINIITVNADTKKPLNVKATITGGSLNTIKANTQVYGKKGKFNYAARYTRLSTNGFSAAYDSTVIKGYDKDGYKGNVANAQVKFQATDQLSFRSFLMYSQYKAAIDAGVFSDEKDYNINNDNLSTGGGFNFKKDFLTIAGTYQYSQVKRTYLNDSIYKSNTIFEDNRYFGKTQFVEMYAAINLGAGFTLLQGADYRYSSYNQQYASISIYGPYASSFNDTSLSQSGLYGSINFVSFDKKFTMEAGGRINTHSRYGNNNTYTFNPSYAASKHVRIFGSIASGFKAPTLYQLSINPLLQPEKSVNYEAGVQYLHNKINSRLVYFNRHIENGIDYNYITFKYFNYLKQVVSGVEYEVSADVSRRININANYTYLHTRETTQNRITNKDTITYDYLLRRPKHNLNITVGYQATDALFLSVTGKYVSTRYDVGGYAKKDVALNDYFIAGVNTSYALNKHYTFFANAQNITNQKFFDVRGYNSIPALVNVGITANW
ncbi:MAG: TonB-dependent receptor [Chitinophagaceae bacterium]|nr:TonB-dependent receptor [Chitinophagaceae bacterium]